MDRRHFLQGVGAGTVGLALPAASSARSCKVIGIGGAGCNFIASAATASLAWEGTQWVPEFVGIDLDQSVVSYVEQTASKPDGPPVKTLALANLGAAGRVNRGRAAALRNREGLTTLLADTEVVFLVAGMGGGTGSGVTPIMARLARDAGALVVAAVITSFEFEGEGRNRTASVALARVQREADLVVLFSNQELSEITDVNIGMGEFFDLQNQRIASFLKGVMDRVAARSVRSL